MVITDTVTQNPMCSRSLAARLPARGDRPRLRRARLVRQVADQPLELAERLRVQCRLDALVELHRVQPARLRVPLERSHDALAIVVPGTQFQLLRHRQNSITRLTTP